MRPRNLVLPSVILLIGLLSILTLRGISPSFATNQLLFFIVSLAIFAIASSLPFSLFRSTRWIWYGLSILLLVITLIIGRTTNGSLSWLAFGSYRLQPSELLKPALILLLAIEFANKPVSQWQNLLRFGAILGLPVFLVMLQPDLGTTLIILAGAFFVFLSHHPSRKVLVGAASIGVASALIAWFFLLQPYQKARIQNFFQPEADPQGSGYNARQAVIAVGSGGTWGHGFGNGRQSNLRFLPERQTDFLFATFAEEQGWVGTSALILLYATLFFCIGQALQQTRNRGELALALGVGMLLFSQTFINIGMNIGLTPVTGVPLPLFSLGGSSLLTTCIALGLLESMRRSQPYEPERIV
jgi:rod shape determining protein RodA